jgi:hypothetical protein
MIKQIIGLAISSLACAQIGVYPPPSGSGSSGTGTGSNIPRVSLASGTLSVGSACATTTCYVRFGSSVYSMSTGATVASLTGSGAASTLYVYVKSDGLRYVGVDGTAVNGATTSHITVESPVASFPSGVLPLGTCAASGGAITSCTEFIAAARDIVSPGDSTIIVTESAGTQQILVNPSVLSPSCSGAWVPFGVGQIAVSSTNVPSGRAAEFDISRPCSYSFTKVAMRGAFGTGYGAHSAVALKDSSGTLIATSATATLDQTWKIYTFATTQTLSAGTHYILSFGADGEWNYISLYGSAAPASGINNMVNADGTLRVYLCAASSVTGTTTIAFGSCGTKTDTALDYPYIVILP